MTSARDLASGPLWQQIGRTACDSLGLNGDMDCADLRRLVDEAMTARRQRTIERLWPPDDEVEHPDEDRPLPEPEQQPPYEGDGP